MTHKILILPGDGIGPEIVAEAAKVLECLRQEYGLSLIHIWEPHPGAYLTTP